MFKRTNVEHADVLKIEIVFIFKAKQTKLNNIYAEHATHREIVFYI